MLRACFIAVFAFAAAAALLTAGPLNPPAGAVSSTQKTLSDVEPRIAINAANTPGDAGTLFRITQPGSYYLTGNINGVSGKAGIFIASADVTIDLNGFAMIGVAGASQGIVAPSNLQRISVRNGKVRAWPFTAVSLGPDAMVEDLQVGANLSTDAIVCGDRSIVRSCAVQAAASGFYVGSGSLVLDCVATGVGNGVSCPTAATDVRVEGCRLLGANAGTGLNLGARSTAKECTLSAFGIGCTSGAGSTVDSMTIAGGSLGLFAGADCVISGVTVTGAGSTGITAGDNCRISRSAVRQCAQGFEIGSDCVLSECVASAIGFTGFVSQSRNTFVGCSSNANTGGGGFSGVDSNVYTNCRADVNAGDGFNGRFGSVWETCSARSNNGDGVETSSGGTVRNGRFDGNGNGASVGANIRVTGDVCRIEGNSLIGADFGIQATSGGNVIVRNSSRNSANSYGGIVGGNDVGPIGSAATGTSPWGNVQY